MFDRQLPGPITAFGPACSASSLDRWPEGAGRSRLTGILEAARGQGRKSSKPAVSFISEVIASGIFNQTWANSSATPQVASQK